MNNYCFYCGRYRELFYMRSVCIECYLNRTENKEPRLTPVSDMI
jgi:hypothetical protein